MAIIDEFTVDPGIDAGKTPEQLVAERSKRFQDVIALRQPDRVPINLGLSYMLAEIGGITKQELHEDWPKSQALLEKAALYFQPDAIGGVFGGPAVGMAFGDSVLRFPGHGLSPNASFQYMEREYMKAEDYDDFIFDPGDWGLRVMLPRTAQRMAGLARLAPLGMSVFGTSQANLDMLEDPEMIDFFDSLEDARKATEIGMKNGMESAQRMMKLGFPPSMFDGGMLFAAAPFDAMSDTLRGIKGIMLDIHRRPEKLLQAVEIMRKIITRDTIATAKKMGAKYAGSMLHRGSDGFMSLAQFEKFYWPSAVQMWKDFVDAGITPYIFFEGCWDQRLEYIRDIPKGKFIGRFQSTNIFRLKEVLGDHLCIEGGMPNSLLTGGTVEDVRALTKELCQKVGKGGGYIMDTQIAEMEGARPELVKAWVDATKEFGQF